MKNKLEEFIRNHKEEFDDLEPSETLWQKLDETLAERKNKKVSKIYFVTKYAVAAAMLGIIITTALFVFNNKTKNDGSNLFTKAKTTNPFLPLKNIVINNTNNLAADIDNAPVKLLTKTYHPKKEPAKQANTKKARKPINNNIQNANEDDYNPEYVIINGKPVKSEDDAIKITETSLNMLAANINKGAENMRAIKYMSVTL